MHEAIISIVNDCLLLISSFFNFIKKMANVVYFNDCSVIQNIPWPDAVGGFLFICKS